MEYTTATYKWEIISVDMPTNHMVVAYSTDSGVDKLNLPIPDKGQNISVYLDKFAPKHRWEAKDPADTDHVAEGMSSTSKLTSSSRAITEQPETHRILGVFQEEYIRALIYQVVEEIKDESV
jgi:hypothetical protein